MMNKLKNEHGASNTIEMIFVILALFSVLITVVDAGMYFNNRNIVSMAAQNGARIAAVYGGASETPIAKSYGISKVSSDCIAFGLDNPVECSVYNELASSVGTVNAELLAINCGPNLTTLIGERTYCEIDYHYKGIPGSGIAIAQFFGRNKVRMTAESEVINK